jgi:N-acetylneuraminic acid mutarotase
MISKGVAFAVLGLFVSGVVELDINHRAFSLGEADISKLPSTSSWSNGGNTPDVVTEATAVTLGGKIYIIGGEDNEKKTNAVRIYDPATDEWNSGAPLPIPLDHAGASAYDGKIYVAGGFDRGKQPTDRLFVYDPSTNIWMEGEPLPEARGAATADFINGVLYVVGGIDSTHKPVQTNEAYDPKSNKWTEKSPMPTPRHHHTSAVVDGKLYVIGGRLLGDGVKSEIDEALSNFDDNEMYDPKNNTWIIREQMPTKRSGLAAAVSPMTGNIYVFGGQDIDKRAFNNSEKYDPKDDSWSSEKPMPTARLGLEAIAIDNYIYVVGGKAYHEDEGQGQATNIIEIFHLY